MRIGSVLNRWWLVAVIMCPIVLLLNAAVEKTIHAESGAFCDDVTEIPQIECDALVALYESTDGEGWVRNDGWMVTKTPCDWTGVQCDYGTVTRVILQGNQLIGVIPPELGNLSGLQWLYLDENQLEGASASRIGQPRQCGDNRPGRQ